MQHDASTNDRFCEIVDCRNQNSWQQSKRKSFFHQGHGLRGEPTSWLQICSLSLALSQSREAIIFSSPPATIPSPEDPSRHQNHQHRPNQLHGNNRNLWKTYPQNSSAMSNSTKIQRVKTEGKYPQTATVTRARELRLLSLCC